MKLKEFFTIIQQYINTNTKAYKESKKGGNARDVSLDFLKFCKKNGIECHAWEGTFTLDKKQENGNKEVPHFWNTVGDGMVWDGNNSDVYNPNNSKKHLMFVDFSVKPTYEDTGLATDNNKRRYKKIKELTI